MNGAKKFTPDEARQVREALGIVWDRALFDVEQFRIGMAAELECGRHDPATDVTGGFFPSGTLVVSRDK
jgi:hypothetical protein